MELVQKEKVQEQEEEKAIVKMKSKLVKQFKYGGRKCVVLKGGTISPYHNGYVKLFDDEIKESYNDMDIDCVEITFGGKLGLKEKKINGWFCGFDTAHYYNIQNPITQTKDYVIMKCKELVRELNKKRHSQILIK